MTLAQWIEAQALVVSLWPHARQLEAEQLRLQHRLVADLELDDVLAAIEAEARTGAAYPPTPGQLAKRCAQTAAGGDALGWASALALLRQAASRFGRARELEALTWLAEQSPHAARFAVEHGWRTFCAEPVDDPQHGGAVLMRLERTYGGVAAALDREIAERRVLPRVADRLRTLGSGRPTSTGPRRLNALEALDLGDRPELGTGEAA